MVLDHHSIFAGPSVKLLGNSNSKNRCYMQNLKLIFSLILANITFMFVVSNLLAAPLLPAEKTFDFNQLVGYMKNVYAPLYYKERLLKINFNSLVKEYGHKIARSKTDEEFYSHMLQFVAEFQDTHFNIYVPNQRFAFLGFTTDLVEGKVVIDYVDREILPLEEFPYKRGDQILALGNKSIYRVLKDLKKYIQEGTQEATDRTAANYVSFRNGATMPVPYIQQGQTTATIRRNGHKAKENVVLHWYIYSPYDPDAKYNSFFMSLYKKKGFSDPLFHFSNHSIVPRLRNIRSMIGKKSESGYQCSGKTRIEIPMNATVLMEEPFVAYYHEVEGGKKIGYVRIPHYYPKNPYTGELEYSLRLSQYKYVVSIFESETDALVIDQTHNCGGLVSYLADILGLFIQTPIKMFDERIVASRENLYDFNYYSYFLSEMKSHYSMKFEKTKSLIEKAYNDGSFLTSKYSSVGIPSQYIMPGDVGYTKPILVLIDELSASCGDVFPKMMKLTGRAKLFGIKTMGAGGTVISKGPLNYSRIHVSLTNSLLYVKDKAVENIGALPDYYYEMKLNEDYLDKYKNYQKEYLKVIKSLMNTK